MGRDHQPKERQLRRQRAKAGQRAGYARILIVTEGSKTEPLYLTEICTSHQLHSANVAVQPSQWGTAPDQVVRYARRLFEQGDLHKGIRPKSFDQVFAVFDRDDHDSYFNALQMAHALDGKLRNDDRQNVPFKAITSVPSFELWLLLHYEDVWHPIHRDEVMTRLKRHLSGYEKGASGAFIWTRDRMALATRRAQALAEKFNAHTAPEPYTCMHELVNVLMTLRS